MNIHTLKALFIKPFMTILIFIPFPNINCHMFKAVSSNKICLKQLVALKRQKNMLINGRNSKKAEA